MATILIIDDEEDIRNIISDTLIDEGYKAITADNVKSATQCLENIIPDVIVLDIWLEGNHMDGIGLLRTIKKQHPNIPIIMISGHANNEIAVQTIKLGAYDFIEKPFKSNRLLILIKNALETKQLIDVNQSLRDYYDKDTIIGVSKAIINIREQIKSISSGNSRVLINGEIGTGKGTLARIIHNTSRRNNKSFFLLKTFNKAEDKISNELFGNAELNITSCFEKYNGGTIFIDEICNLSQTQQQKLLDIIQNNVIVKNNNKVEIDVRFLVATTKNLQILLEEGKFSKALLTRLSTVVVNLPSLRERKHDIQILSEFFCKQLSDEFDAGKCIISDNGYSIMIGYDWPGNVRQLRNVIEKLMMVAYKKGLKEITAEMISNEILESIKDSSSNISIGFGVHMIDKNYKEAKKMFEREYLKIQLLRFDGNIAKTALFINMDRAALHRKLKSLGLNKHLLMT